MSDTATMKYNGAEISSGTPSQNSFEVSDDLLHEKDALLEDISVIKQGRDNMEFDELCDKLTDLKADYPQINIIEFWEELIKDDAETIKNSNVSNYVMLLQKEIEDNFSDTDEFAPDDEYLNTFLPYDGEDDDSDNARGKRSKRKAARKSKRKARKSKRRSKLKKVKSKLKKAAKTVTSKTKGFIKKIGKSALEAVFIPLRVFKPAMVRQLESKGVSVPKKTKMIDLSTKFKKTIVDGGKNHADTLPDQWYLDAPEYYMTPEEVKAQGVDNALGALAIAGTIVTTVVEFFKDKKKQKADGAVRNEEDLQAANEAELLIEGSKMGIDQNKLDSYIEQGKTFVDLLADTTGDKEKAATIAMNIEAEERRKSKPKSNKMTIIIIAASIALVLLFMSKKKA